MKFFYTLLWGLLFFSCSKPDIFLPVNDNPGQSGVKNISQVYIFFKTNRNGDTISEMHKNQIISATHYVVHIDRRLPVKYIISDLEWLHEKRHRKSIHNIPGMHLYFSHIDSVNKTMRLNVFDDLEILSPFYHSRIYVKKYARKFTGVHPVHLDLQKDKLLVNDTAFNFPAQKTEISNFIYSRSRDSIPSLLILNTDYRVSYNRYNYLYGFLVNLDSSKAVLMHKQFWYNPKEL